MKTYRRRLKVRFTLHINHWTHSGADWTGLCSRHSASTPATLEPVKGRTPPEPGQHGGRGRSGANSNMTHSLPCPPSHTPPGLIFFCSGEGKGCLWLSGPWSCILESPGLAGPAPRLWLSHFNRRGFKCKYFDLNFPYFFSTLHGNKHLLRIYLFV